MIKQSVINYFKCLKYVFTPLGVIALGFVCGLSIAIPAAISSAKAMCAEIVEISGKSIDFDVLIQDFVKSVQALDWSDVWGALKTMSTKEWWISTFETDINNIIGDIEGYVTQVFDAIQRCVDDIIAYAILVFVFVIIAFTAAYFLTRWIIRRDIAKRNLWKFLLGTLCGALLSATITAVTIWFGAIWSESVYISAIVAFLLASTLSLVSAYLIHGFKKVPFKTIVNAKNVANLLLSDLIIFIIAIVIAILISLIVNIAVGIFVAIGLVCVTVSVLEMNAEAYVKATAEKTFGIALFPRNVMIDPANNRADGNAADNSANRGLDIKNDDDSTAEAAATKDSDKR